jgi:hypothetical protein
VYASEVVVVSRPALAYLSVWFVIRFQHPAQNLRRSTGYQPYCVDSTMTSEDLSSSLLTSMSHSIAGSTPTEDHASRASTSCTGGPGLVAERIRQYTSSASSRGGRKAAFAEFSREDARVRSEIPQATQSSPLKERTYALPKDPPVRFDLTGAHVAKHSSETPLPEALPRQSGRMQETTPKADKLHSEDRRGLTLSKTKTRTAEMAGENVPHGITSAANTSLAGYTSLAILSSSAAASVATASIAAAATVATATSMTTLAGQQEPVRLNLSGADVAEHIRELKLPEALPQLLLRFQDKMPMADELLRNCISEYSVEDPVRLPTITKVNSEDPTSAASSMPRRTPEDPLLRLSRTSMIDSSPGLILPKLTSSQDRRQDLAGDDDEQGSGRKLCEPTVTEQFLRPPPPSSLQDATPSVTPFTASAVAAATAAATTTTATAFFKEPRNPKAPARPTVADAIAQQQQQPQQQQPQIVDTSRPFHPPGGKGELSPISKSLIFGVDGEVKSVEVASTLPHQDIRLNIDASRITEAAATRTQRCPDTTYDSACDIAPASVDGAACDDFGTPLVEILASSEAVLKFEIGTPASVDGAARDDSGTPLVEIITPASVDGAARDDSGTPPVESVTSLHMSEQTSSSSATPTLAPATAAPAAVDEVRLQMGMTEAAAATEATKQIATLTETVRSLRTAAAQQQQRSQEVEDSLRLSLKECEAELHTVAINTQHNLRAHRGIHAAMMQQDGDNDRRNKDVREKVQSYHVTIRLLEARLHEEQARHKTNELKFGEMQDELRRVQALLQNAEQRNEDLHKSQESYSANVRLLIEEVREREKERRQVDLHPPRIGLPGDHAQRSEASEHEGDDENEEDEHYESDWSEHAWHAWTRARFTATIGSQSEDDRDQYHDNDYVYDKDWSDPAEYAYQRDDKDDDADECNDNNDGHVTPIPQERHDSFNPEDRCCIRHLWGKCGKTQDGRRCGFGPHLPKPTEGIKHHRLYVQMVRDLGPPAGEDASHNADDDQDNTPSDPRMEIEDSSGADP